MLVLASRSPRRHTLLRELGVAFRVEVPDVSEDRPMGASPEAAACAIAARKARAVAALAAGAPVLAADTLVVAVTGEVLGKPLDASDACRMLGLHSGATQRVVTGVCLVTPAGERCEAEVSRVTMRAVTESEIEEYVASGEPFGKAGGYALQEQGERFVTRVEGSRSNVVGLPLELTARMLRAAGVLP